MIAFLIAVVVVVVVAGIAGYVWQQKRYQHLAQWAAARGWTFAKRDDRYADLPWGPPFGTGSGRRATEVVSGRWGERDAVCFTHRYQTSSANGKTSQTTNHYHAIFALRLPKPLPELRVGREGFFSGLARKLGLHDIEFESEDFNRRFTVTADDRKFAYDVLNPRLMQHLLDTDAAGFVIVGTHIFVARDGRLDVADVDPVLGHLDQVVRSIPSFVWNP